MEKQHEKTLFACMAVVEEAAKQAEELRVQAETAVKTLPERVAAEISAHVRFAAEDASRRLEKAVSGIKELEDVSKGGKRTIRAYRGNSGAFCDGRGCGGCLHRWRGALVDNK